MRPKLSVKLSLIGLDEYKEALDDVAKKAEELELAIQRLNDIELSFETDTSQK